MADSKGVRAGRAYVELGTENAGLQAGLRDAEQRLFQLARRVKRMGREIALSGAGGLAAGLGGVREFAQTGEALNSLSAQTRVSVEALQELSFAASSVGGNLGTVQQALHGVNQLFMEAHDGSAEAAQTLNQLGVSFASLQGLSGDQRLMVFADAIAALPSDMRRADLATRVFGASAQQLMPLLRQGAQGFGQLGAEFRSAGGGITAEDAKNAAELSQQFRLLKAQALQLLGAIGSALAPALRDLVGWFRQVLPPVAEWLRENKAVVVAVFAAAAGVVGFGLALIVLGHVLALASIAVTALAIAVKILVFAIGLLFTPIGLIVLALGAVVVAAIYFSGQWSAVCDQVSEALGNLGYWFGVVFGGMADAINAGDLELAVKILWLAVQAAWMYGTNFVANQWRGFLMNIANLWDVVSSGIEIAFVTAWNGWQMAFIRGKVAVLTVWVGMLSMMSRLWLSFADTVLAPFAEIIDRVLGTDLATALTNANNRIQQVVQTAQQGLRAEEIEADRRVADLSHEPQQLVQQLQGRVRQRQKNVVLGEIGDDQELQDLLQQLEAASGEAAAGSAWADMLRGKRRAAAMSMRSGIDNAEGGRARGSSTGTFSALAAGALGGGPIDRVAEYTRRTAEILAQIRNGMTNGLAVGQ